MHGLISLFCSCAFGSSFMRVRTTLLQVQKKKELLTSSSFHRCKLSAVLILGHFLVIVDVNRVSVQLCVFHNSKMLILERIHQSGKMYFTIADVSLASFFFTVITNSVQSLLHCSVAWKSPVTENFSFACISNNFMTAFKSSVQTTDETKIGRANFASASREPSNKKLTCSMNYSNFRSMVMAIS